MNHTVIKLGGSVLRGPEDAGAILEILGRYSGPLVVVVSALKGVTDRLAAAIRSPQRGAQLARELRAEYTCLARAFRAPEAAEAAALLQLERLLGSLERLLGAGLPSRGAPADDAAARILAPRILATRILVMGERLSAVCLSLALTAVGRPAPVLEPGRLGLVARPSGVEGNGVASGDALADIPASEARIRSALERLDAAVVPGFYGVAEDGACLLFGRGGSDYSAAVIAACLGAKSCDFIKDVAGLFTADPFLVPGALPVLDLSYAEAGALARGGANILHPDCVEPLRASAVPLRILGGPALEGFTRVGGPAGQGPRALALKRGPAGSAAITVAGSGCASRSAASVLKALDASGLQARAFLPGTDIASFSVLVEASRGGEALRVAHDALFA
jgi:bifunctional aspartokinase / homoserine dehydrogenase 1